MSFTVRQLRALLAFAGAEDRPDLCRIVFRPSCVYAADGVAALIVPMAHVSGRHYSVNATPLRFWTQGLAPRHEVVGLERPLRDRIKVTIGGEKHGELWLDIDGPDFTVPNIDLALESCGVTFDAEHTPVVPAAPHKVAPHAVNMGSVVRVAEAAAAFCTYDKPFAQLRRHDSDRSAMLYTIAVDETEAIALVMPVVAM